jgi:hypothetical protein
MPSRLVKVSFSHNFSPNHLLKFSMLPFIQGLLGVMKTTSIPTYRQILIKRRNLRGYLKSPMKYIPLSTCKCLGIGLLLQYRMRKAITLSMLLILLNVNTITDYIGEIKRGDGTISFNKSWTNEVHLVHLIYPCRIQNCISLFRFHFISLSLVHFQVMLLHNSLYRRYRWYCVLRKTKLLYPVLNCIRLGCANVYDHSKSYGLQGTSMPETPIRETKWCKI